MHVYMNSTVLMRENVAENVCDKGIRLITTWFLSEHRKSCDRKMSARSNQKMVFKRITPHSPAHRNFFSSPEPKAPGELIV